jgi:hypothetical protein
MSRNCRARVTFAVALLVLAAGCQDYNFNPVGRCLIQTGTKRITLSSLASADVLFVVDDSGSMRGEQTALAENFGAFIGNLDAANAARQSAGLDPFDFNIAVTSTSVLWNYQTSNTCRSNCTGAAGQLVCCRPDNAPARQPRACTPGVTACPAGTTCGTSCTGLRGENYCCDQATGSVAAALTETIPCSREGITCGTFERHYNFQGCTPDAAEGMNEWPLPQGDFMSYSNTSMPNPRVLHFDKELYTEGANRQGFTRQQLIDFFASTGAVPGNVRVGTCGSGTEQALAAARLAIEKARDGRQRDTYPRTKPASGTIQPTWNLATRTAGSPADWFTAGANSKLVVVFVGDEDDCSPRAYDPSGAVVWTVEDFLAGNDSCELDASRPPPLGGKLQPVGEFVDFFTGLGRPVAAAFILPAAQLRCTLTGDGGLPACTATDRCCPSGGCTSTEGAQGRGTRLLATAQTLASRGVEVVAGSICDANFGALLNDIAELVKPPSGLELPGIPAADEVTILRIASSSGVTRKICSRPLAPTTPNYTLAQAQDTRADWWFTSSADPAAPASGATRFVYINPKGACLANPGETYSADYIGRVPEGGCFGATQGAADEMCGRVLGGRAGDWTCWTGTSGDVCRNPAAAGPTQSAPGTCICGSRETTCGS